MACGPVKQVGTAGVGIGPGGTRQQQTTTGGNGSSKGVADGAVRGGHQNGRGSKVQINGINGTTVIVMTGSADKGKAARDGNGSTKS